MNASAAPAATVITKLAFRCTLRLNCSQRATDSALACYSDSWIAWAFGSRAKLQLVVGIPGPEFKMQGPGFDFLPKTRILDIRFEVQAPTLRQNSGFWVRCPDSDL